MVVDLSGNKTIPRKLLSEVNAQVIFKKAVLGVVIVDLLEMHMNHPQLYRNCIFVNRANLQPLLKFIGDRIDALVENHRPYGTPLSIGISSLRNSAEVLAICLKQRHEQPEKAPKKHRGVTARGWYRKKTPQGDDNTWFSLPDVRKVIDEDRDFNRHHDELH
jgi:hypothetical protein